MSTPAFLRVVRSWGRSGPSIFISYRRRGDSAGFAARLTDRLVGHFGAERCFRDIEDIESGTDFVHAIEEAVDSCEVMIVVIGTDWVTLEDTSGGRRLDNPEDFVRIEVATGLRRGIRVVPVLVSGARMPSAGDLPEDLKPLARRQAHEMTDLRWDYDVGRLMEAIEGLGIRPRRRQGSAMGWLFAGPMAGLLSGRMRTVGLSLVGLVGLGLVGLSILPQQDDFVPYETWMPAPARDGGGIGAVNEARPGDAGTVAEEEREPERTAAGSSGGSAGRARPAAPARDAVEVHRPELMASVQAANEASAYALATLDVEELPAFFEGQALQEQVAVVGQMAMNGVTVSLDLLDQRFTGFQVDEATGLAVVDVVERWRIIYRDALTEVCVGLVPSQEMASRHHLRASAAGWIIHQVDGDEVPLEPRPC